MQNKFFGSKLNSVLLLVLIVLMVFALRMMLKNKETYLPMLTYNEQGTTTTTTINDTKKTLEYKNDEIGFSVSYPKRYGQIKNVFLGKPSNPAFGNKVISGSPSLGGFNFIGASNGIVLSDERETVVAYEKLSGEIVKTQFGEYKYVFIPAGNPNDIDFSEKHMAIFKLKTKSGISYLNFYILVEQMPLEEFKTMLQTVKIY